MKKRQKKLAKHKMSPFINEEDQKLNILNENKTIESGTITIKCHPFYSEQDKISFIDDEDSKSITIDPTNIKKPTETPSTNEEEEEEDDDDYNDDVIYEGDSDSDQIDMDDMTNETLMTNNNNNTFSALTTITSFKRISKRIKINENDQNTSFRCKSAPISPASSTFNLNNENKTELPSSSFVSYDKKLYNKTDMIQLVNQRRSFDKNFKLKQNKVILKDDSISSNAHSSESSSKSAMTVESISNSNRLEPLLIVESNKKKLVQIKNESDNTTVSSSSSSSMSDSYQSQSNNNGIASSANGNNSASTFSSSQTNFNYEETTTINYSNKQNINDNPKNLSPISSSSSSSSSSNFNNLDQNESVTKEDSDSSNKK
jgi:hypothetical protein